MKHTMIVRSLFLIVIILSVELHADSSTQSIQTKGKLMGQVADLNGNAVQNAAIIIEAQNTKLKRRKLKSNKAGKFEIMLPANIYKITVEKYGFKTVTVINLEVRLGANTNYSFNLEVGYPSCGP